MRGARSTMPRTASRVIFAARTPFVDASATL
jgi:hypothetical protein